MYLVTKGALGRAPHRANWPGRGRRGARRGRWRTSGFPGTQQRQPTWQETVGRSCGHLSLCRGRVEPEPGTGPEAGMCPVWVPVCRWCDRREGDCGESAWAPPPHRAVVWKDSRGQLGEAQTGGRPRPGGQTFRPTSSLGHSVGACVPGGTLQASPGGTSPRPCSPWRGCGG